MNTLVAHMGKAVWHSTSRKSIASFLYRYFPNTLYLAFQTPYAPKHLACLPGHQFACLNSSVCPCLLQFLLSGQHVAKPDPQILQGGQYFVQWFPVTPVPRHQASRLRHQQSPQETAPHLPQGGHAGRNLPELPAVSNPWTLLAPVSPKIRQGWY